MDRRREQADLILKLGQLFGPMIKTAENPPAVPAAEQRRTLARFTTDVEKYVNKVRDFTLSGEPGHTYVREYNRTHNILMPYQNSTIDLFGMADSINKLQGAQHEVLELINNIPMPDGQEVFAAQSPFSAHCLFTQLCGTVVSELHWQDRYFADSVFDRYLTRVPATAKITIVTWPESKCHGGKDLARYKAFMGVSKLFAIERGPDHYRLITDENFHARWFRRDDEFYNHDDSIKALGEGKTFTVTKMASTPEHRQFFDEPITTGTEVFGPNQNVHP